VSLGNEPNDDRLNLRSGRRTFRHKNQPNQVEMIRLPLSYWYAGPLERSCETHVGQAGKVLDKLDQEGKGINFFRFVVDPEDFGQTVENIFFVSFLIREGRAGIEVKKDGEILISKSFWSGSTSDATQLFTLVDHYADELRRELRSP